MPCNSYLGYSARRSRTTKNKNDVGGVATASPALVFTREKVSRIKHREVDTRQRAYCKSLSYESGASIDAATDQSVGTRIQFSKPRFEPDVQQLAQMKLKGLIPNINNPASVAGTLQKLLGGPKNPAETPQQQAQQPNAMQQLLGLFGKTKHQSRTDRRFQGVRYISSLFFQEPYNDPAELRRLFYIHEMAYIIDHYAVDPRYTCLDPACMRVNVGDVSVANKKQGWDVDLCQPRQRRLNRKFQFCMCKV